MVQRLVLLGSGPGIFFAVMSLTVIVIKSLPLLGVAAYWPEVPSKVQVP